MSEKPFANARVVCGVVIEREGKYLLVQERQPNAYKKWNLPAGHVDEGETLEQAAIREATEECGLDVEIDRHLIVLHQSMERPVLHAFSTKNVRGDVRFPANELLDAQWFSFEEARSLGNSLRDPEFILGAIQAT